MNMHGPVDILVPETGGRTGDAVVASLRAHGLEVAVMDSSDVTNDEPGFIRHLKAFAAECRPRMIMPIFKAKEVARHRSELPAGTLIPVARAEILERLDDKCLASELAASLGIPQPRLYSDSEYDCIPRYPVVFKRNQGLSGSGVYFPRSREALEKLARSAAGRPHLVCDFLEGFDVSVDAVRMEGYFHAECYKVLEPKGKGISTLRESIVCPEIVKHLERMLEATEYEGVCGADFRLSGGKAYFLECNPRFCGGMTTQIAAGFDIPFILWQLATGHIPEPIKFKEGLIEGNSAIE
jgi:Carbamoylphosphate synthase large subunit (split gene in MJ)